jgi:hypothetical protein
MAMRLSHHDRDRGQEGSSNDCCGLHDDGDGRGVSGQRWRWRYARVFLSKFKLELELEFRFELEFVTRVRLDGWLGSYYCRFESRCVRT